MTRSASRIVTELKHFYFQMRRGVCKKIKGGKESTDLLRAPTPRNVRFFPVDSVSDSFFGLIERSTSVHSGQVFVHLQVTNVEFGVPPSSADRQYSSRQFDGSQSHSGGAM